MIPGCQGCRPQERPVVYLNPITTPLSRSRVAQIAWSLLRPVKSPPQQNTEFPAEHERLITPAELMRYGF